LFLGYKRIQTGYKWIQIYPTKKLSGYMPEEKRKINCWIPLSLYNKIESSGFENTTLAIITALERLFEDPGRIQEGSNQDTKGSSQDIRALTAENTQLREDISGYEKEILGYKQDIEGSRKDLQRIQEGYIQDITGYKENIRALNLEIARMTESLANVPEPSELAQLQARYEEIKEHNLTLKAELEKAGQREEDLKKVHNNYMLQVQTLINQKAIEAPGAQKKPWYKFW
jgi:chromosome segregation ATPase